MKKVNRWFAPGKRLATNKAEYHIDEPATTRRRVALKSRGGDVLATARSLQYVANVNKRKNPKAHKIMAEDAKYFYNLYNKKRK